MVLPNRPRRAFFLWENSFLRKGGDLFGWVIQVARWMVLSGKRKTGFLGKVQEMFSLSWKMFWVKICLVGCTKSVSVEISFGEFSIKHFWLNWFINFTKRAQVFRLNSWFFFFFFWSRKNFFLDLKKELGVGICLVESAKSILDYSYFTCFVTTFFILLHRSFGLKCSLYPLATIILLTVIKRNSTKNLKMHQWLQVGWNSCSFPIETRKFLSIFPPRLLLFTLRLLVTFWILAEPATPCHASLVNSIIYYAMFIEKYIGEALEWTKTIKHGKKAQKLEILREQTVSNTNK